MEGIKSPNGLLRPQHYFLLWIMMFVPKVGVTISMRCWAGCPGEEPKGLILSAQQKLLFKQDQVSCCIVTQILQKSCFLFFDVALYWPWCFWGQITKNCSYTKITDWSAGASLCVAIIHLLLTFLDLGHILLCFLSVHHSVLTFTYFYRKCHKVQPKNPQSVVAYSSIWKQELIS